MGQGVNSLTFGPLVFKDAAVTQDQWLTVSDGRGFDARSRVISCPFSQATAPTLDDLLINGYDVLSQKDGTLSLELAYRLTTPQQAQSACTRLSAKEFSEDEADERDMLDLTDDQVVLQEGEYSEPAIQVDFTPPSPTPHLRESH